MPDERLNTKNQYNRLTWRLAHNSSTQVKLPLNRLGIKLKDSKMNLKKPNTLSTRRRGILPSKAPSLVGRKVPSDYPRSNMKKIQRPFRTFRQEGKQPSYSRFKSAAQAREAPLAPQAPKLQQPTTLRMCDRRSYMGWDEIDVTSPDRKAIVFPMLCSTPPRPDLCP
jgi:hypothetical protein